MASSICVARLRLPITSTGLGTRDCHLPLPKLEPRYPPLDLYPKNGMGPILELLNGLEALPLPTKPYELEKS